MLSKPGDEEDRTLLSTRLVADARTTVAADVDVVDVVGVVDVGDADDVGDVVGGADDAALVYEH